MLAYLWALLLTLAVEAPLYAAVLGPGARFLHAPAQPAAAALATSALANLASHPLAFLAVYPLAHRAWSAPTSLVVAEVFVLAVEAAVVARRTHDPLLGCVAAGVANVGSLAVAALAYG